MKADEICQKAAELVSGDRAKTHGDKLKNHENIAALWNAYIWSREEKEIPLSARDVAILMLLLKTARTLTGTHNIDDYVDIIGYASIAGEIADETQK